MVRARASHARGRRFEPCRIHQNTPFRHCRFGVFFIALFRQGERVGAALREQSVFAPLHFAYAFFGRKQTIDYRLAGRAATGASPVESTKTPRFGIAVSGCFLLRFFGRARGWEPLCASKAFSPRYTLLTLSSGENKRLIIVWRGAPLQARALSNPPKHPVSALPFRGAFYCAFR